MIILPKKLFILGAVLLLSFFSYAQEKNILGIITNEQNEPLPYANILLKKDTLKTSPMIGFVVSDQNGKFQFNFTPNDSTDYFIHVSSLGYQQKIISLDKDKSNYSIVMVSEVKNLNEVVITEDVVIKAQNDTLVFDPKKFSNGNEEVIEEVLANLPGVSVDDVGTIKIKNKEIKKVYIDGVDILDHYKTGTQNIGAKAIEKIEVIQNFNENALLKEFDLSENFAINLTLTEKARNAIFGNINAGFGSDYNYEVGTTLMNFSKSSKYLAVASSNSLGKSKSYLKNYNEENTLSNLKFQNTSTFSRLTDITPIPLAPYRYRIGRNYHFSLNAVTNIKPTDFLKMNVSGTGEFLNQGNAIFTNYLNENRSYNQLEKISTEPSLFNLKLNYKNNIHEKKNFNATLLIEKEQFYSDAQLIYNENPLSIDNKNTIHRIRGQFEITNKLNFGTLYTKGNIQFDNKNIEVYYNSADLYGDSIQFINQKEEVLSRGGGVELKYLRNTKWVNFTFALQDQLLTEDVNILSNTREDQMENSLFYNNASFHVNFSKELKSFSYDIQNEIALQTIQNDEKKDYQFYNLNAYLNKKLGAYHRFSIGVQLENKLDLMQSYDLVYWDNYNSNRRLNPIFEPIKTNRLIFSYRFDQIIKGININSFATIDQQDGVYYNNSFLSENFIINESQFIRDDFNGFTFNNSFDYYILPIKTIIKMGVDYSNRNNISSINKEQQKFTFESIKSYLKLGMNFNKITVKTNVDYLISNNINHFYNTTNSFEQLNILLYLKYAIHPKVDFAPSYTYYSLVREDVNNHFLDFEINYTLKKNKFNIYLKAQNLLNNNTYVTVNNSSIASTTSEVQLNQRQLLIGGRFKL
ncbi:carboxypeptidase-like regulatory domain-containing protein [Flammeovirga sp. OC4]|uniref:carboxypeptidase-like regulatory domain-containing protein n=1 Tax=Flammeovirga sp. OC4 TaxID=1382345 RepID=UPI0005C7431C|nr:carboxypeptidase-like regulatory domain-containing protein [Flammeovirga sp. OC4]